MDDNSVVKFRGWLYISSSVRAELLAEGHRSRFTIHLGSTKMYKNLRRHFWWSGIKKHVATFVSQCLTCQQIKAEHQRPSDLLQPLQIPQWKWEHITMDFVVGLPKTQAGFDGVWVIVDRLTKTSHFLPFNSKWSVSRLTELFISERVRLHGVLVSIVSDRDLRFTSCFWHSF